MTTLTLRVVTLNTWKCDGAYDQRLGWMAAGLAALSPDVVFLQEAFVCAETGCDTAEHIAQACGLTASALPGRIKPRRYRGQDRLSSSDLAILTSYPFTSLPPVRLAACNGDDDRQIQIATVTIARQCVRLCNAHFTHIPGRVGSETRSQQAEQLATASAPEAGGFTILGGDLNAAPGTPAIDRLLQRPDRVRPLVDTVSNTLNPCGDPSGLPVANRIIDHLIVRAHPEAPPIALVRQSTALGDPLSGDGTYPSDHRAVVLDLQIIAAET